MLLRRFVFNSDRVLTYKSFKNVPSGVDLSIIGIPKTIGCQESEEWQKSPLANYR